MCDSWVTRLGPALVFFTVCLILFVPITSEIYIFSHWMEFHQQRSRLLWTTPFYIGVVSILINYYYSCKSNPGRVPQGYYPKSLSQGIKPRWCKVCLHFKPPRSHHCSYCKKCTLRMDHHCPWINNCVGHFNIPYFVRFLVSVSFSSAWCLALYAIRVWDLVNYQRQLERMYSSGMIPNVSEFYTPPMTGTEVFFFIMNLFILFGLQLSVGLLALWQVYYVSQNITTIESFENEKISRLQSRGKISKDLSYPYDLGLLRNFKSVFGDSIFSWVLPKKAIGNGIDFSCNGSWIQWPPKEYYQLKKNPYKEVNTSDEDSDLSSVDEKELDEEDEAVPLGTLFPASAKKLS